MRGGRAVRWMVVATALAVACYFFPLFHVVHTSEASAEKIDSAAEFLKQLWTRELPAAHDRAVAIEELLAALDAKPQAAAEQYGRQVGLSDTQFYFARGAGTIVELAQNKALVSVGDRQVCLRLGVLTGSAARDAAGLVDVSRFSRLQDFNALSGQLNDKVEAEVIAPVRDQLAVGARVEFVGCAQVKSQRDLAPLCLTPVALKVVAEEAP